MPTFEQDILPHLDAAFSLARWLLRDPIEAEDVVQDSCLRALRYFDSFRGDSGRAWLLRIVRNASHARLAARRPGLEVAIGSSAGTQDDDDVGLDIADPGPDPEESLLRREGEAQLAAALASLPVELRECLVLCELEQLSYREIARVTGVPIGTVMSRLWRARRSLTRFGAAG